ncbi:hypothetical protein C8R47DRAFT_1221479 [Mycena vitilis]|nr:hypothetical protein C8R47DRAFT_1221479 [Mycena vitilis]
MPASQSAPGHTAKPRPSSRPAAPGPTPPPAVVTTAASASASAGTSTVRSSTPASPPPTSPTPASKLPRFLQSPAQRDRSKSLSVDRPPSAASSHGTHASNSTSTSSASASGRRSATRFLGMGKDKERERERQRIREAERGAPSAAELLTLHEAQQSSPTAYDSFPDAPGSPPSAYGTARPRTRSERHFSASTPPSSNSNSNSSSGHGAGDLTLARTPSRLGADGPLAARLSGWFAHLAGSTSDLSIAATIGGSLSHAAALAASASASTSSSRAGNPKSPAKASDAGVGAGAGTSKGGSRTSLLDKAVRYLLDGDANPDRSAEEIWLMGVRLPGWGREDEERVAAAAAAAAGGNAHSHSTHGHLHNPLSTSKRRSTSRASPTSSQFAAPSSSSDTAVAGGEGPDAGAWPAAFHAAFYAQVWCTYRAGFDPIRDLPSLASLPPPLVFPAPPRGGAEALAGAE